MSEDLTDYLLDAGIRTQYSTRRSTPSSGTSFCATCASASSTCSSASTSSARTRPSRGVAGRDPRRRQGRLPAIRQVTDPDHRPGRPQVSGQVFMYADKITPSMERAIDETNAAAQAGRLQRVHGVDPQPLRKKITDITQCLAHEDASTEGLPLDLAGASIRSWIGRQEQARSPACRRSTTISPRRRGGLSARADLPTSSGGSPTEIRDHRGRGSSSLAAGSDGAARSSRRAAAGDGRGSGCDKMHLGFQSRCMCLRRRDQGHRTSTESTPSASGEPGAIARRCRAGTKHAVNVEVPRGRSLAFLGAGGVGVRSGDSSPQDMADSG